MTGSSNHNLSPFQWAALHAFFAIERRFYLTGGAALVGYHLHHRSTSDLDLFTPDADAHGAARHVLTDVAEAIEAQVSIQRHSPGYLRFLLERAGDGLVVDVVHERVHQVCPVKMERDGVILDPPEEILANKLTTLLSRSEERDLVDVMMLERAGYDLEPALAGALAKDGGCTPAQLAFVLSDVVIPDGAKLPGGVAPDELRTYLAALVKRLRRASLPR